MWKVSQRMATGPGDFTDDVTQRLGKRMEADGTSSCMAHPWDIQGARKVASLPRWCLKGRLEIAATTAGKPYRRGQALLFSDQLAEEYRPTLNSVWYTLCKTGSQTSAKQKEAMTTSLQVLLKMQNSEAYSLRECINNKLTTVSH